METPDTDENGLLDCWETHGVDGDGDGIADFFLDGADPEHKDLYIEVDALAGLDVNLIETMLTQVREVFSLAPVGNPDGEPGIELHAFLDDHDLPAGKWTVTSNREWVQEFGPLKRQFFGRSDNEAQANARALTHRYAIIGEDIDDPVLLRFGVAEGPPKDQPDQCGKMTGNDFFVLFSALTQVGSFSEHFPATFIHELGHTMSLCHGGGDHILGKPNYVSVMNYIFVKPYNYSRDFWNLRDLNLSAAQLMTLRESNLDERVGLPPPDGVFRLPENAFTVFAPSRPPGHPDGESVGEVIPIPIDGSPVDWDGDGSESAFALADLNYWGDVQIQGVDRRSFPEDLRGFDDWFNVQLGIQRNSPYFLNAEGAYGSTMSQEISVAGMHELEAILDIGASADVEVDLSAAPLQVVIGEPVELPLFVRNVGDSPAEEVDVVVGLSGPIRLTGSGASERSCEQRADGLLCTLTELLAGGEHRLLLGVEGVDVGTAVIMVSATSRTDDRDPTNNESTAELEVVTACMAANPRVAFQSTGGGQPENINSAVSVTFEGYFVSTAHLAGRGRNIVDICARTSVDYVAEGLSGAPDCSVEGGADGTVTEGAVGQLFSGDKLTCTDRPAGKDLDVFHVRAWNVWPPAEPQGAPGPVRGR